ncbi:hypothetical protein [uncultured Psychromonas sp.]|uniref:hypothetical protein n=1 Tax=uncultured Psychromonas sp. TaxID=173974 RepID=UPI00262D9884|nr:hypothetical protein [uncultured Psychromonas sp.]
MFVHYTKDVNILSKILNSGLFINQCERKLMSLFTNDSEILQREPQYFGMTCVRHENKIGSQKHCEQFGYFGIVLSDEWVNCNNFVPVTYVNSRNSKLFKEKFELAINEWQKVKTDSDTGFSREALFNKHIAQNIGACKLSTWLTEYEYMEFKAHEYQKEWRYVQPLPLYNNRATNEVVDAIQNPSWSNMLRCLKLHKDGISCFTTSKAHEAELSNWLAKQNFDKPLVIKEYAADRNWLTSCSSSIRKHCGLFLQK